MGEPTAKERGLGHGLRIHRYEQPKYWRGLVDEIENEEERKAAEEYLDGIAKRTRVVNALKRGENPRG